MEMIKMNKSLYFFNLKNNLSMFLAFMGIILMYATVATSMFDPETSDLMQQFVDILPQTVVNMMGFTNFGTELTGYLATYLYGFIMFIFPMIFIAMLTNKLVSKQIDDSSMSYLLTTPNSRVKIATTQALSVLTNIFALILVNVLVVIIISEIAFKGHLMIGRFIGLNFVLFGVMACVSGLTFLISVLISDYGKAVGMSSALMGFLFIMNMIKNLNEDLDFFKYTTFLSLVNIDKILESTSFTLVAGSASLISGLAIFAFSIYIFDRKSLTI